MKDAAHYSVRIEKLQRELNELLAYMAPTVKQQRRIREIAMYIAMHAVSILAIYEVTNEIPN